MLGALCYHGYGSSLFAWLPYWLSIRFHFKLRWKKSFRVLDDRMTRPRDTDKSINILAFPEKKKKENRVLAKVVPFWSN